MRSLEGVGLVREGVMRESIHRDGQRVDELIFGLLRREWIRGDHPSPGLLSSAVRFQIVSRGVTPG